MEGRMVSLSTNRNASITNRRVRGYHIITLFSAFFLVEVVMAHARCCTGVALRASMLVLLCRHCRRFDPDTSASCVVVFSLFRAAAEPDTQLLAKIDELTQARPKRGMF
ncbi:unnamed protein product [Laminaria digitata]